MRDIQVNNVDSRTIDANGETTVIDCAGFGSVGLDIRGTFTATVVPEGTINNSNWVTLDANPLGGGAAVNSITAAGAWTINCAGLSQVRIRCSAYTSGTITVRMLASSQSQNGNSSEVSTDVQFGQWISLKALANLTDIDGGSLTGSPVNLVGLHFHNPNLTTAYIQVFNSPASGVTLGTTKPIESFAIAGSSYARLAEKIESKFYSAGLSFAATTDVSNSTLVTTALPGRFFYRA